MSDYLWGRNSVLEALKAGRPVNRLWLASGLEPGFARQVTELCLQKGIPFDRVDKSFLTKLAGPDHRGVVAQVAAQAYVEVADLLAAARAKGEPPLLVMLAAVEDPHNLGAILRSAYCAGAHGVIIPKRRAASLNGTVAKVAQGAAEHLPVARVANLVQTAQELQKEGLWLVAGDMEGVPYWQVDFSGPLALILGGEGQGIPPLLRKTCDWVASIPLRGQLTSLNVSAAAAVLLYEAVRCRLAPGGGKR